MTFVTLKIMSLYKKVNIKKKLKDNEKFRFSAT